MSVTIILICLQLIVAFIILAMSAHYIVKSTVHISLRFQLSPFITSAIIIGLGTSLPEIFVSLFSLVKHAPQMAIGNVIGSNITNIGLVLGLGALLAPVTVRQPVFKRDFSLLLIIFLAIYLIFLNGKLTRFDGVLILIVLAAYMYALLVKIRTTTSMQINHFIEEYRISTSIIILLISFIGLIVSSDWIVNSALKLADLFNISKLIIGLTIVAIGTSLPEVAVIIVSSLKHEHDITLGNIIGSCAFNILIIPLLVGVITPTQLTQNTLTIYYPYMMGIAGFLYFRLALYRQQLVISRIMGATLLGLFLIYLLLTIQF